MENRSQQVVHGRRLEVEDVVHNGSQAMELLMGPEETHCSEQPADSVTGALISVYLCPLKRFNYLDEI